MSRKLAFSYETAFSHLDRSQKGYLTVEDFRAFLQTTSVDLVFALFDRNGDGKVSQADFCEEIQPQFD